jgi:hypothetical protein
LVSAAQRSVLGASSGFRTGAPQPRIARGMMPPRAILGYW